MTEEAKKSAPPATSWRQKIWNGAKFMARAIFWPGSKKQWAIFLTTVLVLQPLAGMLFPTAKDVLKEEGMNPALAEELAPGKNIHIRKDNFFGKLHAVFDRTSLIVMPPIHYYRNIRQDSNIGGYAVNGTMPISALNFVHVAYNAADLCNVYIKTDSREVEYQKATAEINISSDGQPDITISLKTKPPISSGKIYHRYKILHEISHCAKQNKEMSDPIYKEADADYRAIRTLAQEKNDPTLVQNFIDYKALDPGDTDHDVVLYLDAKFNNRAVPSAEEMIEANDLAAVRIKKLNEKADFKDACTVAWFAENAEDLCHDKKLYPLPPLAQRRVDLHMQARSKYVSVTTKIGPPPKNIS